VCFIHCTDILIADHDGVFGVVAYIMIIVQFAHTEIPLFFTNTVCIIILFKKIVITIFFTDVDNEYGYIMNKALRSYKLHRDKEKAENRQKLLKTAYRRRWHVPQRPTTPVAADRKGRPKSTLPPKMDAIREVGEANTCSEDVKIEDR